MLRKYQSHKVVDASRIEHVNRDDLGNAILDLGMGTFTLEPSVWSRISKMAEDVGLDVTDGYLVIYDIATESEYISWSPPEQFENGYNRYTERDRLVDAEIEEIQSRIRLNEAKADRHQAEADRCRDALNIPAS